MKRKILCTALALVLFHGMTACASAPNIQPEADKISSKMLPQQSLSAPDVTDTVRDSTAAQSNSPQGATTSQGNENSLQSANTSSPSLNAVAEDGGDYSEISYEEQFKMYEEFGLTYNSGKNELLYNGKLVRWFEDYYTMEDGLQAGKDFFNANGIVDVYAVRDRSSFVRSADGSFDPSGKLVGLKEFSEEEFAARDIDAIQNPAQIIMSAGAGNPLSERELEDIAKEYEVFGVTYNYDENQWYFNGEKVRFFRDILTSNGEDLAGGKFNGAIRTFESANGVIDIYTVRDFENTDIAGNGTLTGIEKYSQAEFDEHTHTVRDNTAAETPVSNNDYSANEPSSTTACDPKPDAHLEAEKNSGTPSPQPSLSAPDMTGVVQDSTTKESPGGNIDYSVYEPYGLLYDSQNRCYTFNGSIVRYFNDPAAGASFTNYFTGTVDIEAEYDAKNVLIGIKECSKEVYDYHDKKQAAFSKVGRTDTTLQSGAQSPDTQWLKDYEAYGISYNAEKCSWYYGDERIKVLIDSEKKLVYQTDENGTYLSVVRNEDNIAEIKKISEAEAKDLMKENNPQDNGELTMEE